MADTPQIESMMVSSKVARMWGFGLHSWEQIMLWSLGGAALAALAVTVSTTAVVLLQKEESEAAKQELEIYKLDSGEKIAAAEAVGQAAQADAANANAKIAGANERAATLENDAAQARAEQERLKQIVQWRILTPAQLSLLAANLQAGGSANITYAANDPEALFLWTQISKAFPQPAWKMIAQARTYEGVFHAGIFISGPDIPATKTIRNAFTAAGIAFGTQDPGEPHMFFGEPNIPNVPTVFIASRFPAN